MFLSTATSTGMQRLALASRRTRVSPHHVYAVPTAIAREYTRSSSSSSSSNSNSTKYDSSLRHTRLHTLNASVSTSNANARATTTTTRSTHTNNNTTRRNFVTINEKTPYNLVFLRHGQSTWNRDNRFIGWTDTPLTDDGVLEARAAGQMLSRSGILFDEVHTSLLRRCIRTTNLVLMEMGQEYLTVHKHWRLNERNYGDLVGRNKKEAVMEHGVDQVKRWRRSYDEPPPPMSHEHPFHPRLDPRYRHMLSKIPKSESLECTMKRSKVYWEDRLAPALKAGKTVLVVGHENNLRSLLMQLEGIPEDTIVNLSLPRAVPLAYRLDENLQPMSNNGALDEATGFLRGEWLGGDKAVAEILERDHKQVYDTSVQTNLELGKTQEKWRRWMEFAIGNTSEQPEMAAHSNPVHHLNGTGEHPQLQQHKQHTLNGSGSKRSSSTINGINGSKTPEYLNGAGRVHMSQDFVSKGSKLTK